MAGGVFTKSRRNPPRRQLLQHVTYQTNVFCLMLGLLNGWDLFVADVYPRFVLLLERGNPTDGTRGAVSLRGAGRFDSSPNGPSSRRARWALLTEGAVGAVVEDDDVAVGVVYLQVLAAPVVLQRSNEPRFFGDEFRKGRMEVVAVETCGDTQVGDDEHDEVGAANFHSPWVRYPEAACSGLDRIGV